MRIAGFLKARQEIMKGNLYRALANLAATCDLGVICDDASTDGSWDVIKAFVWSHPGWEAIRIPPHEHAFERELEVKQQMLSFIDKFQQPDWVWWLDADETLDAKGTAEFRTWVDSLAPSVNGVRFHYTQLWRTADWARTDDGFDDGWFLKLWRWKPGLTFDTRPGTHRQQFPTQLDYQSAGRAPFEIIHWGNYGKSLQFKAHQYSGGLGGVDRHLAFGHTPAESLATGVGYDVREWSRPNPVYRSVPVQSLPDSSTVGDCVVFNAAKPKPYSLEEIRRIRSMRNLRGLPGWFTVAIPAFNRADTLPKALQSLLDQRYEQWIAVVLDDGSTDETALAMSHWQERDPRIFYCRYNDNRGGVAVNELGMAMACEMTEWWTRLGSDDWFGPGKLEADAAALRQHEAVFGPFTVWKHGKPDHICAGEWGNARGAKGSYSQRLLKGEFLASWVNVAVRTSVLHRVRQHFGSFCDSRLRNMEDFLGNARIATMAEWVWRPGDPADAVWVCHEGTGEDASVSASANAAQTAKDHALTMQLIREMQ